MRTHPKVVTVTLSPALDLTIATGHLEAGSSHRVEPAAGRLGGKGINVARVLASTGTGVYALGPVAREHWPQDPVGGANDEAAGRAPGADAEDAGDTGPEPIWRLTPTPARLRRSYAFVEDSGRATVFNERASVHPPETWAALRETIVATLSDPAVRVLVLSGSTPADCPEGLYRELVTAAHAAGALVIVDTSGPGLLDAARAGADWVKPNEDELRELFGHEDPTSSAEELVRAGARHVLISRGSQGVVLVDATGQRMSARLPEPLQGNPTGAGDAAVAALAAGLAELAEPGSAATALPQAAHPDPAPVGMSPSARLGDDALRGLLMRAVALSAAAVLMPQAGQVHPSWRSMRDHVITSPQSKPTTAEQSKPAAIPGGTDPGERP